MGRSRVIVPRKLSVNPAGMARAITNTLNGVALDIKADFDVTAQTWQHKPSFAITSPSAYAREISTDDEIYRYINDGTRVRYATMTPGFVSKTLPSSIMSRSGSGGVLFIRRDRPRPGIQAREFDKVIAEKWDKQFATVMQRAIDAEV